ncbi:CotH kinase family protein [Algoriphagus mannitolivorans]|uniref:CotH kinase family protein n=1 Tax=Algoriphagus mannitolivorans TaxID=226504 RepID=UPI0003F938AD|nr:CotH kinase family protein [Algoriphagus mannitolivorans]
MLRKLALFLILVFGLSIFETLGQESSSIDSQLSFSDQSQKIENLIQLDLAPRDFIRLRQVTGKKEGFNAKSLKINGQEVVPTDVHSRGQTTLSFPRKSLSIDLEKPIHFSRNERETKLKHLILLSLAMDKYYIRNRLAFGMMQEIGLMNYFFSYSNLEVNGTSQGIYLLVERPQDWAIHKAKSPIVIRRGYGHSIEKAKTSKTLSKSEAKELENSFKSIYQLLKNESGSNLYESLGQKLDLENYMSWMAFNFLVRNGDYADEVFFYIDPESGLFKIIPWDYDDIFSAFPHEGKAAQRSNPTAYIFSKEDELDKKIAEDEFLYSKYLEVVKDIGSKLSVAKLKAIFEETYAELYPYYTRTEVLQNAKDDLYPDAYLEKLQQELASDFLMIQGALKLLPKD